MLIGVTLFISSAFLQVLCKSYLQAIYVCAGCSWSTIDIMETHLFRMTHYKGSLPVMILEAELQVPLPLSLAAGCGGGGMLGLGRGLGAGLEGRGREPEW